MALGLAILIFSVVAVSNTSGDANLFGVLGERIRPILAGSGLAETNREYIQDYAADTALPTFGAGLGNANLLLTDSLNTRFVASFSSVYLHTAYSTGVIGLVLLAWVLVAPIVRVRARPILRGSPRLFLPVAAYVSWLLVMAGATEGLSEMFALVFAVVAYESRTEVGTGEAAERGT